MVAAGMPVVVRTDSSRGARAWALGATLGVLLMMWVRWTLPRLRIDQVMATCLKYCTPLAAVMFLGAMLWQIALPGGLIPGLGRPAGEIREGWLPGPGGAAAKPASTDGAVAKVAS